MTPLLTEGEEGEEGSAKIAGADAEELDEESGLHRPLIASSMKHLNACSDLQTSNHTIGKHPPPMLSCNTFTECKQINMANTNPTQVAPQEVLQAPPTAPTDNPSLLVQTIQHAGFPEWDFIIFWLDYSDEEVWDCFQDIVFMICVMLS